MNALRVGTRESLLATTQTRWFVSKLLEVAPQLSVTEVLIKTEGDTTSTPLSESKTPGVFVSALRDALLAHEVDFVVHSMKDLPAKPHPQILTACVPEREDVRDALVSSGNRTLAELPPGARVGTSSPRRAASIRKMRPDLVVDSIRGNVDSRIQKVHSGEYEATLLALAGLRRIGREAEACQLFDPFELVPAPGQGALSIECRAEDKELIALLAALDHPHTRITTTAERAVLVGLDAGCATAIGAHANWNDAGLSLRVELSVEQTGESLTLDADYKSAAATPEAAEQLGLSLAERLLAADIATRAAFR